MSEFHNSESDFQPLFDILKVESIKIEQGDFTKRCNKKLYESISKEFKNSWEMIGIGECISSLEEAKANSDLGAVRPPQKSPEEQVRYQNQEQLRKKKAFYEKQLQFQGAKLEVTFLFPLLLDSLCNCLPFQRMIGDVVNMRDVLTNIGSKRSDLVKNIKAEELKIKELESVFEEIGRE